MFGYRIIHKDVLQALLDTAKDALNRPGMTDDEMAIDRNLLEWFKQKVDGNNIPQNPSPDPLTIKLT